MVTFQLLRGHFPFFSMNIAFGITNCTHSAGPSI